MMVHSRTAAHRDELGIVQDGQRGGCEETDSAGLVGSELANDKAAGRDSHMSNSPYHMLVNPTPVPRHTCFLAHSSATNMPSTCRSVDKECRAVKMPLCVPSR
jgi:hypothetical protein